MTERSDVPSPAWDELDAIVQKHGLKTLSLMDTAGLIWKAERELRKLEMEMPDYKECCALREKAERELSALASRIEGHFVRWESQDGSYNYQVKDAVMNELKKAAPQEQASGLYRKTGAIPQAVAHSNQPAESAPESARGASR